MADNVLVSTDRVGIKQDIVDAAHELFGTNIVTHNPERSRVVISLDTMGDDDLDPEKVGDLLADKMSGGDENNKSEMRSAMDIQSF